MKRFIAAMLAATALTASAAFAQGTVTVVTSFSKDVTDPFKAAFEAAHPDYMLEVQNKNTNAGVQYLQETKANNQADLFWASAPDAFYTLKSDLLLAQFTPSVEGLPDKVGSYDVNDPDGFFFGFAASGYGIMWNERYIEANGLAAPAEWSDLKDPQYFDHVVMAAPSRSGTTHLTVETILQGEGWNDGWGTLKEVGGNFQQVMDRSFGVPDAVNSGQAGIGIVIDFFAFSAQASGFPVGFSYPSVTTVVPANIAIVANAPNHDGAATFINFLLSDAGQEVLLEPTIRRLPINPATYAKAPEGFPNPFEDDRFQAMIAFNGDLSSARTDVVDVLFDQLVTFQLDNLKAATYALHAAEAAMEGKDNAEAAALIEEARALIAAMPVDQDQAISPEITDAFTGGDNKTARQSELEQEWASFAATNYTAAKAKADAALALLG